MAFHSGSLIQVLNVKVDLVKSQTQELHASLEAFIDKIQSDVIAVSTETVAANRIAEINSRLDASLALLMGKWPQINDISEDNMVDGLNLDTTRLPGQSVVQTELLSEISQLLQRIEKVETDVTLVLNHQLSKEAEIQAAQTQILKIEDDLKIVAIEKLNSEKEHNSRFESLDNRVKVLEEDDRLSSLQKTLEDDSDVKQHELRLNTIDSLIQQLQIDCSEMDKIAQKHTDEVQTLNKSVRDIYHRQDKLESSSDTLSDRVETAMDRIVMSNVGGKHEMGEFNKRLSIYNKKLDNLDSLFHQVCHMVSTKVNPLCRLQAILNKNHDTLRNRNTILQQMKAVNVKVDCLSRKVRKVELNTEKCFIGFTAYFQKQMKVIKDSRLTFTDVRCNEGKRFHPSGTFTANRDGIYIATVTLSQSSAGSVCVHIIQASARVSGKVVCKAQTNDNCVNSCGIGVASLKAGDTICVMVKDVFGDVYLSGFSSFSCVLIC